MKDLEKMLMKLKQKEGDEMDPKSKQAKEEVLQELLNMAHDAMGSKFKNDMDEMQKVTVAAKDPEALQEGLAKAQEMVGQQDDESMEDPAEEKAESPMEEKQEEKQEDEPSMFAKKPKLDAAPSESPVDDEEKPKRKKLFSMLDDE